MSSYEYTLSKPISKHNLYDLLSRPWFQRVWTVQEFVLAKDVQLHIGHQPLKYSSFKQAMLLLGSVFDSRARAAIIRELSADSLCNDSGLT